MARVYEWWYHTIGKLPESSINIIMINYDYYYCITSCKYLSIRVSLGYGGDYPPDCARVSGERLCQNRLRLSILNVILRLTR